jgi:hypothetical protein
VNSSAERRDILAQCSPARRDGQLYAEQFEADGAGLLILSQVKRAEDWPNRQLDRHDTP